MSKGSQLTCDATGLNDDWQQEDYYITYSILQMSRR